MSDASLYGLDSDLHIDGDGRDYDDPGARLQVAGHGGSRGNSIARCDNRLTDWTRPFDLNIRLGNCAVDLSDKGTDSDRDSAAGGDAPADTHADTALRTKGRAGPVHSVDGDAEQDTEADMDTIADVGAMQDTGCAWSLPSVLLG